MRMRMNIFNELGVIAVLTITASTRPGAEATQP